MELRAQFVDADKDYPIVYSAHNPGSHYITVWRYGEGYRVEAIDDDRNMVHSIACREWTEAYFTAQSILNGAI